MENFVTIDLFRHIWLSKKLCNILVGASLQCEYDVTETVQAMEGC